MFNQTRCQVRLIRIAPDAVRNRSYACVGSRPPTGASRPPGEGSAGTCTRRCPKRAIHSPGDFTVSDSHPQRIDVRSILRKRQEHNPIKDVGSIVRCRSAVGWARHTRLDEDASARRLRDGDPCAGPAILPASSHAAVVTAPGPKPPRRRFHTTKTHFGHGHRALSFAGIAIAHASESVRRWLASEMRDSGPVRVWAMRPTLRSNPGL